MNPWAILGVVLLWLVSLGAVGHWQHGAGVADQKVADQGQFDRVNAERNQQQATAAAKLAAVNADNLQILAERDALKTNLEKERAKNRIATDDLTRHYVGLGLRFGAAQDPAGGGRSGGPQAAQAGAPGAASGTVVQLPDALAGDLRRLAADADKLADDYRECKGYADAVE